MGVMYIENKENRGMHMQLSFVSDSSLSSLALALLGSGNRAYQDPPLRTFSQICSAISSKFPIRSKRQAKLRAHS